MTTKRLIPGFLVLLVLTLATACGGEDGDTEGSGDDTAEYAEMQIYVGTASAGCGDACPPGMTEAYQDSLYLVCNECTTVDDCGDGAAACSMQCGAGCENDTAGCCVVLVCE